MGVIVEMSNKHNLIRPVYPSSGSAGIRFLVNVIVILSH